MTLFYCDTCGTVYARDMTSVHAGPGPSADKFTCQRIAQGVRGGALAGRACGGLLKHLPYEEIKES